MLRWKGWKGWKGEEKEEKLIKKKFDAEGKIHDGTQ